MTELLRIPARFPLDFDQQEYEFDEESMRKYEISDFCQICQSLSISHRASQGKKEMMEYKSDLDDSSSRKLDAQRLLDVSVCLFKYFCPHFWPAMRD